MGDSTNFDRGEHRVLTAIGVQLGLAIERARLRRDATEGEILRRTDELKTALLHAVSHDLGRRWHRLSRRLVVYVSLTSSGPTASAANLRGTSKPRRFV